MTEREGVETELISLQTLVRTPGWELYDRFLQMQEKALEQEAFGAKDPHSMAVKVGRLHSVRTMRTWPIQRAEALQAWLDRPPE